MAECCNTREGGTKEHLPALSLSESEQTVYIALGLNQSAIGLGQSESCVLAPFIIIETCCVWSQRTFPGSSD